MICSILIQAGIREATLPRNMASKSEHAGRRLEWPRLRLRDRFRLSCPAEAGQMFVREQRVSTDAAALPAPSFQPRNLDLFEKIFKRASGQTISHPLFFVP